MWRFPWSLNHFHSLVKILTEGCGDSHIKKHKDITRHLEKGRNLFRKTRRWKNVFSKEDPKEYFFGGNPKEPLSLLEGEWRFYLGNTRRKHLNYQKAKEDLFFLRNFPIYPKKKGDFVLGGYPRETPGLPKGKKIFFLKGTWRFCLREYSKEILGLPEGKRGFFLKTWRRGLLRQAEENQFWTGWSCLIDVGFLSPFGYALTKELASYPARISILTEFRS